MRVNLHFAIEKLTMLYACYGMTVQFPDLAMFSND